MNTGQSEVVRIVAVVIVMMENMHAMLPFSRVKSRNMHQSAGLKHMGNNSFRLALLYEDWGKEQEAEQFYQHALVIYEQMLSPEHPTTLRTQDRYAAFSSRK